MHIEDVPDIVGSCCVLHNICQIHGDSFDDSWLDDSFDSDVSVVKTRPVSKPSNGFKTGQTALIPARR